MLSHSFVRHLPRFRQAYQALETLAAHEDWSRDEIEYHQLAQLNAVWRHAVAHVPFFRRLATLKRLPLDFKSLSEYQEAVPVLPKSRVKAERELFLSERPQLGGWKRTGGSTGAPMSCFWAQEAYLEMLRTRYRFYQMWGIDIFDPVAFLWGHSASFLPGLSGRLARLRQPLEDLLRNRLRLSAYNLGRDDLRDYLSQVSTFQPVSLYGYSRALAHLAREAEESEFACPSLKLAVLTGEPALPHLVDVVECAFQVPAVVEYGAIECGVMASEWPDRTLRVREDFVLMETLPRDDGQFDIVVSVLNNPSFPLLRYAIADVTDRPLQTPDRGFAILSNVAGRNNDFILTRRGRCVHSARFDAFFKYECANVKCFRVRQRPDGTVFVSLELDDPSLALDTVSLSDRLRVLLEGYPVKVEIVPRIKQTPAGKLRLVVSDLTPTSAMLARGAGDMGASQAADQCRCRISAVAGNGHSQNGAAGFAAALPPGDLLLPPRRIEKATLLRQVITSAELSFVMEAHNGLSAKIAEEAGFEAIWASGLSIAAALGVRDSNEASWTQVLEVLDFMSDATRIPILVDGDTGHGNFNIMQRFVRKLDRRHIGGVCIEDKLFPKTNSFINGSAQPLADIDEFSGKIKAGKDAQESEDFVIVARVEAFIAGWGLREALRRAEAYHAAGADAILIHSAKPSPEEVLSFLREWAGRSPVVLVPTKYYTTPTDVFRDHGVNAVIWANHLMRSSITAMQKTAHEIFEEQTLINVEDRVAPLADVFRLQGESELAAAEKRYLPQNAEKTRAIVLAASRGNELGHMTADRPKCMVSVGGEPILSQIVNSYRAAGIKDITVVRGYCKEAVNLDGITYVDNDDATSTKGVFSLYKSLAKLAGSCLISYGDVLFKKYVPQQLIEADADFAIAVDANWKQSCNANRYAEYVRCSEGNVRKAFYQRVSLQRASADLPPETINGEWMGFLKVSAAGAQRLRDWLTEKAAEDVNTLKQMTMLMMLDELASEQDIRVIYSTGNWLDIDSVDDVLAGSTF